MDLIKTVYLCSGARTALEAIGTDQRRHSITSTVSGGDQTVTIPMARTGAADNTDLVISVGLLRQGQTWATKLKPDLTLRLTSDNYDAPYWINGVALDFDIPEGCDWQGSELIRNLVSSPFAWVRPVIVPGEIPNSKNSVSMVTNWQHSITSTTPVPGDRIDVQHLYRVAPDINLGPVWFHTETFVGGVIVARRAHPAIANLLVYDVEAEDQLLTNLLPTDYYLYDIGDPVYPFVAGDSRTTLEPTLPVGSFRLAPLELAGRGVPFSLSYSTFTEYANLRVLIGTIISVSPSNSAVVSIDGTNYTLDISYHCTDQSTANGYKAFKPGDAVLVLWSGYRSSPSAVDMVVIGHLNTVIPCIEYTGFIVTIASGTVTAILVTGVTNWTSYVQQHYLSGSKYLINTTGFYGPGSIPAVSTLFKAGNTDWKGTEGILSYYGCPSRYGSLDYVGTRDNIFYKNQDIGGGPGVLGAGILRQAGAPGFPDVLYLAVAYPLGLGFGISVKPLSGGPWTTLAGTMNLSFNGGVCPVFFSGTGWECASVISGQVVIAEINPPTITTVNGQPVYTFSSFSASVTATRVISGGIVTSMTVAVDYIGTQLVSENYTYTNPTTRETVYGELVAGPPGSTYDSTQSVHSILKSEALRKVGTVSTGREYTSETYATDIYSYGESQRVNDKQVVSDKQIDSMVLYRDLRDGTLIYYKKTVDLQSTQNYYYNAAFDLISESHSDNAEYTYVKAGDGFSYTRNKTNDASPPDHSFGLSTNGDHLYYPVYCGISVATHPQYGQIICVIEDTQNTHIICPQNVKYSDVPGGQPGKMQFVEISIQ